MVTERSRGSHYRHAVLPRAMKFPARRGRSGSPAAILLPLSPVDYHIKTCLYLDAKYGAVFTSPRGLARRRRINPAAADLAAGGGRADGGRNRRSAGAESAASIAAFAPAGRWRPDRAPAGGRLGLPSP